MSYNFDDLIEYCFGLYGKSLKHDKKFNEYNYEWHLGYSVVQTLIPMLYNICTECPTLYGIRVMIDYVNPTTIKLYKDITDDL